MTGCTRTTVLLCLDSNGTGRAGFFCSATTMTRSIASIYWPITSRGGLWLLYYRPDSHGTSEPWFFSWRLIIRVRNIKCLLFISILLRFLFGTGRGHNGFCHGIRTFLFENINDNFEAMAFGFLVWRGGTKALVDDKF